VIWPQGVRVGFSSRMGDKTVTLGDVQLTPEQARIVARELLLRADHQERTEDTRLVDGIPRRVSTPSEAAAQRAIREEASRQATYTYPPCGSCKHGTIRTMVQDRARKCGACLAAAQ
jgi:hypothetical protein